MHKPKFKILSIDGGGIRGIIPCVILRFIETQLGRPTSQTFDLLAGTSTGGIIALGLTKPDAQGANAFSAQAMLDLYIQHGGRIFSNRPRDFWSRLSSIHKTTGQLFQEPYDSSHIEHILEEYFGEGKLGDSLTHTLVTTYEIQRGKPFYFASRLARNDERENIRLKQIARSTSAAPTFFEPALVRYDQRQDLAFVDGGVFANNPSILAYCEAKELWKRKIAKAFEPDVLADDKDLPFHLLSLGTGHCLNAIPVKEASQWRSKDWIEPLLSDVFMRSVAESTDFTLKHLLPPYSDGTARYDRLDFEVPAENARMDDASPANIQGLRELAEAFVESNKSRLLALCDHLY